MRRVWSKRQAILRRLKLTPATEMLLLAIGVGLLGGCGALLFKKLIFSLQELFWSTPDMSPDSLLTVAWYRRLLLPALGGAIVGPLIYFLAREARGHGVPEVMIAVITRNSIIRPVVVLVKTLASAVSIASGGSVGREGPIVQIGAAIASTTGQVLRLHPVRLKTLVGCGVSAGIAATFDAPMAGALFSLELIVADFGLSAFTPILVSAVAGPANAAPIAKPKRSPLIFVRNAKPPVESAVETDSPQDRGGHVMETARNVCLPPDSRLRCCTQNVSRI